MEAKGPPVQVGLLVSAAEDFRRASLPLFEAGIVDAIEWNLDMGWSSRGVPPWVTALLDAYEEAGRLHGHGVEFSLFSAPISPRQERWLANFERELTQRRYARVSEHFGFLTAGAFINNTVMPHPRTEAALRVGRDRLALLADLGGQPVGLENLALAFGRRDVEAQPDFLEDLLAPGGGHLLLDLHNLLCQAENFGLDPMELLHRHPLDRVRELHLAGGELSHPVSDPEHRPFRRDSHIGRMPEAVFTLLAEALLHCPNLDVLFIEQADDTLSRAEDLTRYQADFRRVRSLVSDLRGCV